MPMNPQIFDHISKKSKPNDKACNIPPMFVNCESDPLALSPPNVNPNIVGGSKRLFFDHSSKMLIDTPPELNGTTYRRFFVSLSPSKSLEKEKTVSGFEAKDQSMKEVLSLYPEKKLFESMVGMVTSRLESNLKVDSDYLEEMLAFYLIHNEDTLHGHIFSAYLRLMVDFSHTFG